MQRWIEANPERWNELRRARDLIRRARKRGTQTERIDLAVVLAKHGMICHLCGDGIASLDDLHFDHVIPLARGGTHTYDNLRPAHATCNLRKGAAMPA
ncbi:MAG TPA: HNH endonuclease signature motif containing protein [Mycobacteriales bacterium]|nr:HNH endonuclease signature motif containing protein [Mycobacteriales bacterium]